MLVWYPKIKDLDIPQPETEIYKIPDEVLDNLRRENLKGLDMNEVHKLADKIGYPLFLRTDLASGKHFWERSCYVEERKNLKQHIFEVIAHNLTADIMGLDFKALAFRKYIPMKELFTAFFGNMPVNPEIRFFIRDGKIQCWHWYWIEDAIENPSVKNWEEVLEKEKKATMGKEIRRLKEYVQKIIKKFPEGYWSIDFCKSKEGEWILIDMATGKRSWKPKNCEYYEKPKSLI